LSTLLRLPYGPTGFLFGSPSNGQRPPLRPSEQKPRVKRDYTSVISVKLSSDFLLSKSTGFISNYSCKTCYFFTSVLYDFYDRPHLIIFFIFNDHFERSCQWANHGVSTVSVELTDQLEPQVDQVQDISSKNAVKVCEIHHQFCINHNNFEFYIHRHTLLQLTKSSYLQWLQ